MSKCNEIIHAAYTAIKENKPIDDIIPYDLSCFTDEEREEIYMLGAVHFKDERRRQSAERKLHSCLVVRLQ
jgi:hypothetical protein